MAMNVALEIRKENAELLKLWEEARSYGWRMVEKKPLLPINMGMENAIRSFTIVPPKDEDPRRNWAAIWRQVPSKLNGKRIYIYFPHWLENEISKERPMLNRVQNKVETIGEDIYWLWDLAWSRYSSTGEGFEN